MKKKKTDYNNLLFETDDKLVVKSFDFLKDIVTLYDLLICLLDNSMTILTSTQTQIDFFKAITVLIIIISNMKTDITDQSEEEKKKIFAEQENILSNTEMLLKKRGELIDQFSKNNIISKGEKYYYAPKKSEESISKKSEQKFDQSILKQVQVSKDRLKFIKLKINTNKDLDTMINNKRYTLNDATKLVNKTAEQKIGKNKAIKAYNNLLNKVEQIVELRSTPPIRKMLKIFNYLGEILMDQQVKSLLHEEKV